MQVIITVLEILAAIFVFGVIIFVHELGHFVAAKIMGVKVNEFAMGMGPKLVSFGKKETKYTVRLFPIGGFCAMEGEDPETAMPKAIGGRGKDSDAPAEGPEEPVGEYYPEEEATVGGVSVGDDAHIVPPNEPENPAPHKTHAPFYEKKVWRRVIITVAGATMNLVLGFVLLVVCIGFFTVAQPNGDVLIGTTTVNSFQNYVGNAGFEDIDAKTSLPGGWTAAPAAANVAVSDDAHGGQHAVSITLDSNQGVTLSQGGYKKDTMDVAAAYTLKMWVKYTNITGAGFRIGLKRTVSDTDNADFFGGAVTGSSDWTQITVAVPATDKVVTELAISVDVSAGGGQLLVDDVSLTRTRDLLPGDTIIKVDGKRVMTVDYDLSFTMQTDKDGIFDFTVRRTVDGKKETVLLKNVAFDIVTDSQGNRQLVSDIIWQGVHPTVGNTLAQAGKTECSVGLLVWRSLVGLLRGQYGLNDLSGPIGTMDYIGQAAGNVGTAQNHSDFVAAMNSLLMLVIMITVNVGIFNLLPFPGLDGGRLIFLIIEGVTRRKVPAKYEGMIHFIGLALLMLLMVVITFSDVFKIFN